MYKMLDINGTQLAYYEWEVPNCRGVVQISHGMAEYLERYQGLAAFLNEQGFTVVGADHRGHGHSCPTGEPIGYFGDGVSWNDIVGDLHAVRLYTQKKYVDKPYFFVGHSMGSLLLRDYLSTFANGLAGAAIIGTADWPKLLGGAGMVLANIICAFRPRATAGLLYNLSIGPYNKGFPQRTGGEWLTRDEAVVDAYIADPLSGYISTNGLFRELMRGTKRVSQPARFQLPVHLPLYIASGEVDPVGGAAVVKKVAAAYKQAGQTDQEVHIYPQARHEIFQEINRAEVFADLGAWLQKEVEKAASAQ
ncbi:MAG: alpha/beta hydrolase [Actinomycetaceae bacterium]|nr:alpha/beta hydrolase [Actinomycetaceae bacterium]